MTVVTTKEYGRRLDVIPVSLARPVLSPPRASQAPDSPFFCYRCPNTGAVKLIDEELTLWPHVVTCDGEGAAKGLPTVLRLGTAIFVGAHLFKPSQRERLLAVLEKVYTDDLKFGSLGRWIETRAVGSEYEPTPQRPESMLFGSLRAASAKPRAKAPASPIEPSPSAA